MYKLIAFLSAIIREFYLPNPYINFFNSEGLAELFNIFVGGIILHSISFNLTRLYYTRGENAARGSLIYLAWYIYCIFIFDFIGTNIHNIYLVLFLLPIIYVLTILLINKVFKERIK